MTDRELELEGKLTLARELYKKHTIIYQQEAKFSLSQEPIIELFYLRMIFQYMVTAIPL